MNYQAFTHDSLTVMYEAIRGALAADDALKRQRLAIRFRVRETPDWKCSSAECVSRSSIGQKISRRVNPVDSQIASCADSITQKAMGLGESPISHARRTVLCRENCADRWTTPRA
jgi:hypothetical protein